MDNDPVPQIPAVFPACPECESQEVLLKEATMVCEDCDYSIGAALFVAVLPAAAVPSPGEVMTIEAGDKILKATVAGRSAEADGMIDGDVVAMVSFQFWLLGDDGDLFRKDLNTSMAARFMRRHG